MWGLRDYEGVCVVCDNFCDIYCEWKSDNVCENYFYCECDCDCDWDGFCEKCECDRENLWSSYYCECEGDDGKRKCECDSERLCDCGGECYKDCDCYGDGEILCSKERYCYWEERKDFKKVCDEKKENFDYKYEKEEGEVE